MPTTERLENSFRDGSVGKAELCRGANGAEARRSRPLSRPHICPSPSYLLSKPHLRFQPQDKGALIIGMASAVALLESHLPVSVSVRTVQLISGFFQWVRIESECNTALIHWSAMLATMVLPSFILHPSSRRWSEGAQLLTSRGYTKKRPVDFKPGII